MLLLYLDYMILLMTEGEGKGLVRRLFTCEGIAVRIVYAPEREARNRQHLRLFVDVWGSSDDGGHEDEGVGGRVVRLDAIACAVRL